MISGLLILIISYLIGSFPTAIIAGKLLKNIDVREHGSGNAGATNVFRVLGWKAGVGVMIIDIFKGFAPVFWLPGIFNVPSDQIVYFQIIAAVGAVSGHIWTIFAGFKGGKGVATSAGVFWGLLPLQLSIAFGIFIIVVAVSKYVSLGSLTASLSLFVIVIIQRFALGQNIPDTMLYLSSIVFIGIWILHKDNIKRLLSGTENKLTFGKKKENSESSN
jgi:glycerol-3-phosphate acyltransferase PlsY